MPCKFTLVNLRNTYKCHHFNSWSYIIKNTGFYIPKLICCLDCFLFFFLTFLLEYNCFTVVCQFLFYNKVNQLYIYIYPPYLFPLASPSLPPSLSHPSSWSQSTELISLCYSTASHQLSILHLVVYIYPYIHYHSLTLSQLPLPPSHVLKSILQQVCVFIPVLPLGSS